MAAPIITIPSSLTNMAKTAAKVPSFIHTLYLFTANDFATFAIPTTLFAVFAALSGSPLTTNPAPSLLATFTRIPLTLAVVWSNLFIFNVSNQWSPIAVEEDRINKPHRPIPSGRLTSNGARLVLLAAVPVVLLLGWTMNVWEETLLVIALSWMYNDLGGSEEYWIIRNLLIALGYGLYSSAALRVMAGPTHTLTQEGVNWVGAVTGVMFVTQHICDIKDAEGDRLRGRRSAPIELGDEWARWSVAVPVVLCSAACPWLFDLGIPSYLVTLGMGGLVAGRTLLYRDLKSDKKTWKLWALWTCGLFVLPLVGRPEVLVRAWLDARELLWQARCMLCAGDECAVALNLAAVSSMALIVEARRALTQVGAGGDNGTVPEIIVEVVG